MAEISANGIRFHVQQLTPPDGQAAEDPTVVFVHGLVMDNLSSFYYTLAGPTVRGGARAILYDLRGHGRSERTAHGYSTHDGVADLCALLDALGVTKPVYLVGNSYGGIIAARMAVAVPERVAGLVLIEASSAGPEAATWFEDMTNTLTAAALGLEYDRIQDRLRASNSLAGKTPDGAFSAGEKPDGAFSAGQKPDGAFLAGKKPDGRQRKVARLAMHADALLNGTSLIDDLAAEPPMGLAELARIRCPVLGVYGERSELAGAAAELRRHVPDCRIEMLPGLAHTVLREATSELTGIVTGWLPLREMAG